MAYQFPPDVEQLVRVHMAQGSYVTEDDLLRDALRALGESAQTAEDAKSEYQDAVAAVREGAADTEAGRVTPLRRLREIAPTHTPEKPS